MNLLSGIQGNAVHHIEILMDVRGILALQIAGQNCAHKLTRGEIHMLGYPIDGKAIRLFNIRVDNGSNQSAGYARFSDLILLYVGPIDVTVLHQKVNALWSHELERNQK